IRDNIRYGKIDARDAEIAAAAKLAHAPEVIDELERWKGPRAYAPQVGPRRAARARARGHRRAGGLEGPARLRRPGGRARRQALGRPARARRDPAGDPQERADPGA